MRRRLACPGIKTERLTFYTFINMGVLSALAGLIFCGTPEHGNA